MKRTLALTATLLATCVTAFADGGGSFTVKGTTYPLKSAYAYSRPDPFDAMKQSTVIAFSEKVLDAKKINAAADRESALTHAMGDYFPDKETKPANVEVMFARADPQFPIQQIGFELPGRSSSASVGAGKFKIVLKRNDAKRIEGTLVSSSDADKTAERGGYFDLHFELDVAEPLAKK